MELTVFKLLLDYGALGVAFGILVWVLKMNGDRYKRNDEVTDRLIATATADATNKEKLANALTELRESLAGCPRREDKDEKR